MDRATKVYVAVDGEGRRLTVNGDLGLLEQLLQALQRHPTQSPDRQDAKVRIETAKEVLEHGR